MDLTKDEVESNVESMTEQAQAGQSRAPTMQQGAVEDANLVGSLTEEEQRQIVDTVIRDFDADTDSRTERMRRLKEFQGLYASVMRAKAFPFRNSANINLPVLATAWLQIQGRLFDMVWPADGNVMYSQAAGPQDVERANATELFGNAYLRHRMPEMPQGIDDSLHQLCGYGSAFRRTYWNSYEGRVCSDWIPIEDFVVAQTQRSQDPSMRDVPRYTLVQHLTYYDIESYGAKGIYSNTDKVKPTEPEDKAGSEFQNQLNKIDGTTPQTSETTAEDKPRFVLEQHRIWRMPNAPMVNPAFDGKPHPVMVTVDNESRALLRMVIREEPDPDDFARFQREQAAFDAHMTRLQSFVREAQAAQMAQQAAAEMGQPLPPDFQQPAPPVPPPGVKVDDDGMPRQPEPQRKRELCFFTHYRAFPSEGFYGLGLGDFVAGINKAANTLINQHVDGGTLRNAMPGFISAQLKGQRGTVNVQPGEMIEVDAPMGSIRDGMYFPEFPPPDPSTMRIVQMLLEASDKMVASSDIMSGQSAGSNRTAKETEILQENVMMQLMVLARRVKEAFKHELAKIWRLWGVFLPDEDIVDILGPENEPMRVRIGKAMFTPNAHVVPAADPRTKIQRRQDAMQVFQAVSQNPYLMNQPPPVRDALMRAVTEDVLRAMGAGRLVKMLPPPQPQSPPPPPPPAPYWEENAGFFRGQDHPVSPADDDMEHIAGHQQALQGPAGQVLDKQGRDMLERHIRFHVAGSIQKTGQRTQQIAQLHAMAAQHAGPVPQGPVQPAPPVPMNVPMPQVPQ